MSDYNSSLPVRTETNGDVAAKIVDGTVVSQALAVDSSGRITVKLDDGAGNSITSVTNGGRQGLDTYDQADGPVAPGAVATYSILIGGQFNTTLPTLTNTQQAAIQVDNRGRLLVATTNSDDHNYGTVGANTLRTAAQIGNATGAADFNAGATGAQTLRVVANQGAPNTNANGWFVRITDGTNNQTVTAGGASNVNAVNFPTTVDTNYGTVGANTLRGASQIGNATGAADFNFGTVGAQTLRVAAEPGNATGIADFNFGTVGAQTLRTAAQIGNATGAADFNNGATGAQTLRVAANLAIGGANVTTTNPVPVFISDVPGTHVNDYKDASAIAAAASDNHDYTVTAAKTLHFNQIESSASGKAKMLVQVETGVATGVFTSYFVKFNSTAETNMSIILQDDILVAAGVRVRVVMTNLDKAAQDLYSTISGFEV